MYSVILNNISLENNCYIWLSVWSNSVRFSTRTIFFLFSWKWNDHLFIDQSIHLALWFPEKYHSVNKTINMWNNCIVMCLARMLDALWLCLKAYFCWSCLLFSSCFMLMECVLYEIPQSSLSACLYTFIHSLYIIPYM